MTVIYFVRHAEPIHTWKNDRSRPLSEEGLVDRYKIMDIFKKIKIEVMYSSPYKRSFDTIDPIAKYFNLEIITDERFVERKSGHEAKNLDKFKLIWGDFDKCEVGGETLGDLQKRNVEALYNILEKEKGRNIIIGTHGSALSSINNYFNKGFGLNEYLRIIDLMPYVQKMEFENEQFIKSEELFYVKKPFKI